MFGVVSLPFVSAYQRWTSLHLLSLASEGSVRKARTHLCDLTTYNIYISTPIFVLSPIRYRLLAQKYDNSKSMTVLDPPHALFS